MWKIKWFIIKSMLSEHERFLIWTALRDASVRKFKCIGETLIDDARLSNQMHNELVDYNYENEY